MTSRRKEEWLPPRTEMLPSSLVDIEACIEGDQQAWDRLVVMCIPAVRLAVRAILGGAGGNATPEEVEDLVQETFLSLLENDCSRLRAFNPAKAGFVTWISLVARQRARDASRRGAIVTLPLEEAEDIPLPAFFVAAPDLALPEGILSPRERLVIELSFHAERSLEEIGGELGISCQAVKNHKSSGLRKLRDYFQEKKPPRRPAE